MNQASAQYVQQLDLGEDPFSSDFSGSYFFHGASRKQLLDQVIHLSRFGDHVVIVTGDDGSGKTTMLDATFVELQPLMDCCHINAQQISSPDDILHSLSDQLRLHLDSPINVSDFQLALEECSDIGAQPEPVLVGIDQAHYLDLEGFECLLDLFNHAQGAVRLLLVGEYQLEELLRLAGFAGERTKAFDLEPLALNEIDEFLMGLLRSVGYAGNQPLSTDQLSVLSEHSGGNISEIKRLTSQLLSDIGSHTPKRFSFAIPTTHLIAITILAVALSLSFFYQGEKSTSSSEETVQVDQSIKSIKRSADPVKGAALTDTRPLIDLPKSEGNNDQLIRKISLDENSAEETQPEKGELAVSGRLVVDGSPIMLSGENRSGEEPNEDADLLGTVSQEKVVDSVESSMNNNVIQRFDEQDDTTVMLGEPEVAEQIESEVEEGAVKEKELTQSTLANKVQTSSVKDTRLGKMEIKSNMEPAVDKGVEKGTLAQQDIVPREQRLMNLPSTAYMLQLLGSVEEKRSREFVKEYVGKLPVTYAEVRRDGKPWYVVLTGPFDNRADAVAAISRLPAPLQRQKPWARSIVGIQKDILNRSQ